jgi:alpha-tubulin suppressor-like RCC1 family protein
VHAPELVALKKPTAVSAGGSHTCAIAEGGVWCWGDDRFGQCGGEVMDGAVEPQLVAGTEDVVELAAGVRHTCARTKDARVLCWGELIGDDGEPAPTAEARLVPKLDHVREITAGAGHTCALRDDGRVWCWGHNESGQLGDGTTTSRATPMQVPALERSLHIAAGGLDLDGELVGHTCVETREFNARCWGRNNEGQLGTGTAESSTVPTTVLAERDESSIRKYLDEVVSITTGGQFSCSLDNNGPVRCWGTNESGQLGLPRGEDADFGRPSNVRRFSRPE